MQAIGSCHLETLEQLPPQITGGDEDELPQASEQDGNGQEFEHHVAELSIRASILNPSTNLGTPQKGAMA